MTDLGKLGLVKSDSPVGNFLINIVTYHYRLEQIVNNATKKHGISIECLAFLCLFFFVVNISPRMASLASRIKTFI